MGFKSALSHMIVSETESQRLEAVRRYDILDTPPDGAFERITAMAARRFGVPISIVSIVDTDRIWFKSHHGLSVDQIGRDPGLCASAILANEAYILTDARFDPRSLANSLVAGDFGLRFYAGVPLQTHDGHNLGTLCVIDREPRTISQEQISDLNDLASVVMDHMELRLSARRSVERAELMAREIDHRVMNSLQFISSLLAIQSRSAHGEAVDQLKLAANRVAAVAQVHRNFYSDEAHEVSCISFLRRLCNDLGNILDKTVEAHGDEDMVPTTFIQPIGLLVNELVTNAAKHGAGKIEVAYRQHDGVHELSVCDEGEGLPPDIDPETSVSGLGMRVIKSLVGQLNGTMTSCSNPVGPGTCFRVSFPGQIAPSSHRG